jgi:hypothetical protein
MPACPGDPTPGFTEYEDSFVVQRPYTLAGADRIKYQSGVLVSATARRRRGSRRR